MSVASARLFFLGTPRFERDGQPVEVGSAKAVALLAYLAAADRPQPRDRLLALLWTESAEEAARKNLRNTLWAIRKALGEDVINAATDRLSLSLTTWADTRAFASAATAALSPASQPPTPHPPIASLQSAIALYAGPFLDDLTLTEAPDFEIWQTAERERLAQLYVRGLASLVDFYRSQGQWAEMIAAAEAALRQDDLQEGMYRALMEGHARLGDRPAALRQYETLRSVLERELGVAPLQETEALRAAVLSGGAGLSSVEHERRSGGVPKLQALAGRRPESGRELQSGPMTSDDEFRGPRSTASPPSRHSFTPPLLLSSTPLPFVGRSAERAALETELEAAGAGAVRVVLITGEVGIGKSRLWQEWAGSLPGDSQRVMLETRCLEPTRSLPMAPVAALMRSPACARLFSAESPVPRVWLTEAARLLPEIRAIRPDLPAPSPLAPEEEQPRLFEALAQCLLAFGTPPLIVFVDDVHWADGATLAWLGYLAGRFAEAGAGLMLGLTYRPDDAPAALLRLAAGWGRQGLARRIPLDRLKPEEIRTLANALGVTSPQAESLYAQSAGNPYFLIELARAGAGQRTREEVATDQTEPGGPASKGPGEHVSGGDEGSTIETPAKAAAGGSPAPIVPLVLQELIRARLERLSGQSRQVLQAAAVLEPDLDFVSLRRTAGRGEEETLDALDELLLAGVLVEGPRFQIGSRGPSGELLPAEVDASGPGGSGIGTVYNFSHPLVAEVMRGGLSGARRAFLYRRAAQALEAGHADRIAEVAGRLAAAYREAGDSTRAAASAELAAQHALALGAAGEAVAFYRQALATEATPGRYLGLGQALFPSGDLTAARAALQSALDGYLAAGDRLGAARTSLEIASSYLPAGRGDEVLRWAEQSLVYLDVHAHPEIDPQTHALAHFLLGAGRLRSGGSLPEAEAQLAESARLAEEKDLPELAARSQLELGNLLAQRGDLPAAIAAYHACIRLARAAGDRLEEILGYNNAAYHEMLAGDLPAARRDIEAALALDEEWEMVPPRQYLYSTRGEIALAEGQWDEAENWLRRGLRHAERQGNREQAAGYYVNLALAARGRGDPDASLDLLETARDLAAALPVPFLQAQIDLRLAELHGERGERAAAQEALSRAESRLANRGYARLEEWAKRLRAEIGR